MGTRSLTYVYDDAEKVLVCMYRQFDGYPSGHGMELAQFLAPIRLVNGLRMGEENTPVANGMGCLAAQIICHFKSGPGGIYLHRPVQNQDAWQEYEYHVHANYVVVKNPKNLLFKGSWAEFLDWCGKDPAE